MNYYNEFDPNAAQWLRNLINVGLIPPGYVDDRSILDVKPSDLAGFTQCHWFAGIGGWPLALAYAGISHDTPLWTGSPPCQPFSVAGLQKGSADPRHLAPAFLDLIGECRPRRVYGEQVAAATGKDDWLDALCIELEAQGYLFGASVLPAAGIGAAHKRERLFFGAADWMADANSNLHRGPVAGSHELSYGAAQGHGARVIVAGQPGGAGGAVRGSMDNTVGLGQRQGWHGDNAGYVGQLPGAAVANGSVADAHHSGQCADQGSGSSCGSAGQGNDSGWGSIVSSLADANSLRLQGFGSDRYAQRWEGSYFRQDGLCDRTGVDWYACRDGKARPAEPGTMPLVDGIPKGLGRGESNVYAMASRNRNLRLKGYGNAIHPLVAAQYILAFEKSLTEVVN